MRATHLLIPGHVEPDDGKKCCICGCGTNGAFKGSDYFPDTFRDYREMQCLQSPYICSMCALSLKDVPSGVVPRWMAEKMIDEIPGCEDPTSTVFEPACGEGAFLTCVLRRKLARASGYADKIRACQTCYGIDIQYDNVTACRAKLAQIAMDAGVCRYDAEFIFARNIIHGDMIFFPMIARFYDQKERRWTNLEEMSNG